MDFTINHADDAEVAALKLECARLTFENAHLRAETGLYPPDRPLFTRVNDLKASQIDMPTPIRLVRAAHCGMTLDPVLGRRHIMAWTHGARDAVGDLAYEYYMEDPSQLQTPMQAVVLGDMHKRLIMDLAQLLREKI